MKFSILAIDAGNTRIKWGLHDGTRWARQDWIATANPIGLGRVLAGLRSPDAILISHVAGEDARAALAAMLPAAPVPRWIESAAVQCGVRNLYTEPARLGCDRWAALIGARRLQEGPVLVVNAGTALTIDGLTAEGDFIGGIIVPGAVLMRRALAEHTAGLGLQDGRFHTFPRNTADAIASGSIAALCGAVERMARLMNEAGQAPLSCILSGGDAPQIAPHLNLELRVVDNLVLEGLLTIAWDDAGVQPMIDAARPHLP